LANFMLERIAHLIRIRQGLAVAAALTLIPWWIQGSQTHRHFGLPFAVLLFVLAAMFAAWGYEEHLKDNRVLPVAFLFITVCLIGEAIYIVGRYMFS
jgi:hypothetical protein